jgi:hypothetical protein
MKSVEDQVGVKRKPGRPKLSTNLVLALLMFLSIITSGLGMEIKGQFKFCDLYSSSNIVMDISRSCSRSCSRSGFDMKGFDTSRNYSILTKTKHAVYGNAHQCKMTTKEYTYTMTFLGEKYETYREAPMILKRADCEQMIILGDVTLKLWNAMAKLVDMMSYHNLNSFG